VYTYNNNNRIIIIIYYIFNGGNPFLCSGARDPGNLCLVDIWIYSSQRNTILLLYDNNNNYTCVNQPLSLRFHYNMFDRCCHGISIVRIILLFFLCTCTLRRSWYSFTLQDFYTLHYTIMKYALFLLIQQINCLNGVCCTTVIILTFYRVNYAFKTVLITNNPSV